jgi:hypothetical protein
MNEELEKLYNNLNQKGLYTKSLDEFQSQFSTPEKQEVLYNNLNQKELYTKSFDDFKSQFFTPSKKKVQSQPSTESKSVSGDTPSASDSKAVKPVNVLEALEEVGFGEPEDIYAYSEELSDLYDQYLKSGQITPNQQRDITQILKDQKEGNRGVGEVLQAYTEGFFNKGWEVFNVSSTSPIVPVFKYDSEKDLVAARERKNKVDFLEALPNEKREGLERYANIRSVQLTESNKNVLAENEILVGKSQELKKAAEYHLSAMEEVKALGREIPEEGRRQLEGIRQELEQIVLQYNSNIDIIEENTDDISEFQDELNLLQRNYRGYKYYYDVVRLSGADVVGGLLEVNQTIKEALATTEKPTPELEASLEAGRQELREFRGEIQRQRGLIKDPMSISDVDSASSFGYWLMEQVSQQVPVLVTLGAGGAGGVGLLSASAAGQKVGELEDERTFAQEKLAEIEELLKNPNIQPEQKEKLEKSKEELEPLATRKNSEIYLAGAGVGFAEAFAEKVTLGLLSKGKRAYQSAVNSELRGEVNRGVSSFIKETIGGSLTEGGSEVVNQIAQNSIDKFFLGNEDVHILDGTADALASGAAISPLLTAAPSLAGMGVKALMGNKTKDQVLNNNQRIQEILAEIETRSESLSDPANELLNGLLQDLLVEQEELITDALNNTTNLSTENIQRLIDIDKQVNKIKSQVVEITDSEMSDNLKQEILTKLKTEFDQLTNDKQQILDKDATETNELREPGEEIQTEESSVGDLREGDRTETTQEETVVDPSELIGEEVPTDETFEQLIERTRPEVSTTDKNITDKIETDVQTEADTTTETKAEGQEVPTEITAEPSIPTDVTRDQGDQIVDESSVIEEDLSIPPTLAAADRPVRERPEIREARAARNAVKDFVKKRKGEAKNLSKKIKDLTKKGYLSTYESGVINKKLLDLNLDNKKQVDRFTEYFDKKMKQVENRTQVRRIRGFQSKLRKKSKSSVKTVPENIKALSRDANTINARYLDKKDLAKYEKVLEDLVNATSSSSSKKYSPIKEDKALKKLQDLSDTAQKNQAAELALELGLSTDLSLKEIQGIIDSTVAQDALAEVKAEKKQKALEALQSVVEGRAAGLGLVDKNLLSTTDKSYLKTLENVKPELLNAAELRDYIKVADNVIINNNFSSSYDIISKIKTLQNLEDFNNYLNTTKSGKEIINTLKGKYITEAKDFSLILNNMFGNTTIAARFNKDSGMFELSKKYLETKREVDKVDKEYNTVMKKALKKNKGLNNAENIMYRGIIANLIQGETEGDFTINKSRVEQTIKSLEAFSDTKKQAQIVSNLYDKLKGFSSQQEVLDFVKNSKDGNYDLLDYWLNKFESTKEGLRENTENVYGEKFTEVQGNYLPIAAILTDGIPKIEDLRPASISGRIPSPRKSTTTFERAKSKRLPENYRLNLDFEKVMLDKLSETLYDINVSAATRDVKNFFDNKGLSELIGADNRKLMSDSITRSINIQRGLLPNVTSPIARGIKKLASTIRRFAVTQALGSITAYPKQFIGVMANAATRLPAKDFPTLWQSYADIIKGDVEIAEIFLSERAQTFGGTRQTTERLTAAEKRSYLRAGNSLAKSLGIAANTAQDLLFSSLRKGDVHAAKATWIAYYKSFLRKKGVKVEDIRTEHLKLDNDPIRQQAASFANQNVEETQIASDQSREAGLYSQDQSDRIKIFRDVVAPYSRFVLQSKMRMLINYGNATRAIKRGDKESRDQALRSLGGSLLEQATFHGVNLFVLKAITFSAGKVLSDLLGFEDDNEFDWGFKVKQYYTNLIKDMNPFVIGNAMETLNIEALNWLAYVTDNEAREKFETQEDFEKSLKKAKKSKAFYRYADTPGFDFDLFKDLGVYQGALDTWSQLSQSYNLAFSENPEIENKYGGSRKINLSEKQQGYMKAMFAVEFLSSIGLFEAETYRMMKKIQREQVKQVKDKKKVGTMKRLGGN